MKHGRKTSLRMLSLLLTVLMLMSVAPLSVFAAEGDPTIQIEDGTALPGSTVTVDVKLKDNPGIATATMKVSFDTSILTLQAIVYGDGFADGATQPETLSSPVTLSWSELSNVTGDVTFASLTFLVSNAASDGTTDITLSDLDIINIDENDVDFQMENGSVEIVSGIPGDINGDGERDAKDLLRARKYFAGWQVEADPIALDANGDGDTNSKDLLRLRKFFAGWDVEIWYGKVSYRKSNHVLELVAYKNAGCEEDGNIAYWYCADCGKYYSDANGTKEIALADTVIAATGHTPLFHAAVPAKPNETGQTEWTECEVCHKVLVAPQPVPWEGPDEGGITYNIAGEDTYLQSITIENPNPSVYTVGEGLTLQNLSVPGYTFTGWYTSDGTKITEIPSSASEDYVLTAKWRKESYSVQFNVRMIDPDQRDLLVINKNAEGTAKNEYTSDKAWVLPTLTMDTYTFVGWSDQYGNFYTDNVLPKGTSGDLILKDNWVSQRNRAVAKTTLDNPLVVEDLANQIIYFAYEIGTIENVPLYTTQDLNCVNGIVTIVEKTVTHSITEENMKQLATSLTKETTDSTQFELSQGWTDTTQVSEEYLNETGKTRKVAETEAKSQSSTQSFNTSSGGTSQTYQYNDSTTKDETNQSYVVNKNLDTGMSMELTTNVTNTTELSAGVSFPIDIVKVDAGVKNTTEVSVGTDTKAYVDSSIGTNASWDNHTYNESNQANSSTNSAYWNTDSGYSTAQTSSTSSTVSNAIHELVSESYGYGQTYSTTSGTSSVRGSTSSTGSTTEEVAGFTYTTQEITSQTVGLQTTGNTYGNYRLIMAGTLHAFAVVGYDVAKRDYFVYTYYVMGDGTRNDGYKEIMDYSYDRSFADWENTVIPFSIPEYVNQYVNSRTTYTEGLEYTFDAASHTAVVDAYTGTDRIVYIPSYMVDDEGTAYRVTGFTKDVFKGKNILAVSLGRFITEIPNEAFMGCASLEYVVSPRVTSIGDSAFSGCTSLKTFEITESISHIGTNAFVGVPSVNATVDTAEKAKNIASSGAKAITLDISKIPASESMALIVESGDSLTISGGGKTFTNLSIESHATYTKLSKMSFNVGAGVPITLDCDNVTLYSVTVTNGSGFDMLLLKETTKLLLSGTNSISSAGGRAVLCRNVNVTYENSGRLNVAGDILTTGTVTDEKSRISFSDTAWSIKTIAAEEFDLYRQGEITVTYDVNGGDALDVSSKSVFRQTAIGELPTPTREYYDFDGWYTKAEDGDTVTAESTFDGDITIFAHWIANTSTLVFDATGGTVDIESKTLNVGGTVGELPTPTRDYYSFAGWFTEAEGGTEITAETEVTDNQGYTAYAHWTQNATSDWVLASEVPADAETVSEKWSYTKTTNAENRSSSMDGYSLIGSYWQQTGSGSANYASFPSGFDTSNWIYTSFAKSAYSAYDNGDTKRDVSNTWSGYVYWHWMYDCGGGNGTSTRTIYNQYGYGPDNNYLYKYFGAFTSTNGGYSSDYGYCNSRGIQNWIIPERTAYSDCQGATRWFRFDFYTSYYTDYQKIYQHQKIENLESSTAVSEGSGISNVQHWVQYRAK